MQLGPFKSAIANFVTTLSFFLYRFNAKKSLQKEIEGVKFEAGWTMTAMAMNKALASFKKEQRKDKNTARVRAQE